MLTGAGLAAWGAVIVLPLAVLLAAAAGAAGVGAARVLGPAGLSIGLSAVTAAAAVVLGFIPGRLLGTSARGRLALLFLLLLPMLLPRYMLHYAWALLATPTSALGRYLSAHRSAARFLAAARPALVMVLWYWPLAALLIAQGHRAIDADAWRRARLDAGRLARFCRITLPLLARPLALAFVVVFVLSMSEYGTFHLANITTVGTELADVYLETRSEGAVARAAWPLAAAALIVGVAMWRRAQDWSVNPPTGPPESGRGRGAWAFTVGLVVLSPLAPVGLLAGHLDGLGPFGQFLDVHTDKLIGSAATSAAAAVLSLLIAGGAVGAAACGRAGRALSGAAHATIFLAMFLPGSIVAMGMIRALSAAGAWRTVGQSWLVVSAGQAARFAGIGLVLLIFARDARERHLAEMASVDGASWTQAWLHVHLHRAWPVLLAAFLLVGVFAMGELAAATVLLPPGVPSFAMYWRQQMHYLDDQEVIGSCLVLTGVFVAVGAAVAGLWRFLRARPAVPVLVCALGLWAAGCRSDSARSGVPGVVGVFGRTGRGRGQFTYPRAIDMAPDGTLAVVDKSGRIQRLTRAGECLGVIDLPQFEAGYPTGLSFGPDGNLYVADTHYHRVLVFSPHGKVLRTFGRFGEEAGCFIYPTDVAFSGDGRVFVSEYGGNDRVSVFDERGEFLSSFGAPGAGEGRMSRPSALCADRERKRLYVADACNHRIGRYNLRGELAGYIGSPGRGPGQLRYPYDLALLADGTLVVCEYGNNRIQLLAPDGRTLGTYGSPGRALGELAYPWGVTVDERRRAYVVDAGNDRVQVWKL